MALSGDCLWEVFGKLKVGTLGKVMRELFWLHYCEREPKMLRWQPEEEKRFLQGFEDNFFEPLEPLKPEEPLEIWAYRKIYGNLRVDLVLISYEGGTWEIWIIRYCSKIRIIESLRLHSNWREWTSNEIKVILNALPRFKDGSSEKGRRK